MNRQLVLLLVALMLGTGLFAQPVSGVFEEWVNMEGTQHYFMRSTVKVDPDGYVYVAGATLNGDGNYDLMVSKYTPGGDLEWTDQFDGAGEGDDAATALAIDPNGYVYVTGTTFTSTTDTLDVVTIKYDASDGSRDWVQTWSGASDDVDLATCIGFLNDKVYVGGITTDATNGHDFLALRYDDTGTLDWDETYDHGGLSDLCARMQFGDADLYLAGATHTSGLDWDMLTVSFDLSTGAYVTYATASGGSVGFDRVRALERDLIGNLYLTGTVNNGGSTGYDIHTVKIDTMMNVVWDVDYSGSGVYFDEGTCMSIDGSGNVFVGGYKSTASQGTDFVTLMYDDAGSLQWAAAWNDTADGGDTAKAIIADGNGNVVVTGAAWNGSSFDYRTIAYDYSANLQWEMGYNSKFNLMDSPSDIAVSDDGGIVVAGQAAKADDSWQYATVKYRYRDFVIPADSDSVSTSLRWIANHDQLINTDGDPVERVRYYSNQCYPNIYMMDDSLSYVFFQGVDTTDDDTLHRIDMTFVGSNGEKRLLPLDKAEYWNNYYLGHIPDGRPFVPLYTRAIMQDVWPNIDVVYSSNQRGLKYYLVVNSGGEYGAINLKYHGAESLYVDGNDALVIESSIGELVQPQAIAYEMDAYGELSVLGWQPEYDVSGDEVTFMGIGSYSGSLVLEVNWGYVDAVAGGGDNLYWSTYFAGSNDDKGLSLALDNTGGVFCAGYTESSNFPVGSGAPTPYYLGREGFAGHFGANRNLMWTTFVGGSGSDAIYDIEGSSIGQIYCTGLTFSNDLPTAPGSFYYQTNYGGNGDAFIFRFQEASGTRNLLTYFGGSGYDLGTALEVANQGVYLAGVTQSSVSQSICGTPTVLGSFPICSPSGAYNQTGLVGGTDGFVAYFVYDGSLTWSTYFGGEGAINDHDAIWDMELNPSKDRLFVAGGTSSSTVSTNVTSPCAANGSGLFPLCNPGSPSFFKTSHDGDEGFIAEFNIPSHSLEWATFVGGHSEESIGGIAIGSNGNIYIAGTDLAGNLTSGCGAATNGDFSVCNPQPGQQTTILGGGTGDNFVARFGTGRQLLWAIPFGTPRNDHFTTDYTNYGFIDIAVDGFGNAYVLGSIEIAANTSASSSNYPSFLASSGWYGQNDFGNLSEPELSGDAYLAAFDQNNNLFWSTVFGGSRLSSAPVNFTFKNGNEDGVAILANGTSSIFITGGTGSPSTPPSCPPTMNPNPWCQSNSNVDGMSLDAYISEFDISGFVLYQDEVSFGDSRVHIFPNPSLNSFTVSIECSEHKDVFISVFDMHGHQVGPSRNLNCIDKNQIEFDLSGYPAGVYVIKANLGTSLNLGRVLKL